LSCSLPASAFYAKRQRYRAEKLLDFLVAKGSPSARVTLGLTTVAEGVEQASQAYALESLGVTEVQGYFYAALNAAAALAGVLGLADRVPALRERARRLRERFEADFWLPDQAYYAMALDGEGRPCRQKDSVISPRVGCQRSV